MKNHASLKMYLYGLLAYVLLSAVATVTLVTHPGIIGHNWDWGIDWNFEGLTDLRNNAFSAWSDVGLGGPNIAVSNAIYYYILAAFGSPKVLSDAVLLLMFPLGAISGMFLVRQTLLRVGLSGFFAAWLGGLTFGFSPFFFNEFQGGVLSQLLGHVGFAFVLALLTLYMRTGHRAWIAVAAGASILLDSSVTDFIFSFPVAFVLLCVPITRTSLRAFGGYALGVIGVNGYWLISFVHAFLAVTATGTAYDTATKNLVNQAPQAWEMFTNSGYPFSFFDNAWRPLVILAGISAISIFFGALLFARKGYLRAMSSWLLILFAGIGIAGVGSGPLSVVTVWAYSHVPFMNFLRTPQHLLIVPTLAFAVLIGVGWGVFFSKPRSRYVIAAVVLVFLVARAPYFTGDLSSSFLTSVGPGRGLSLFQPSPGYVKAAHSIDASPRWSRVLFVPSTFSPLFVTSPFQQTAQGGDPFVLGFAEHGSLLADALGVMNRPGREMARIFNDRLPESLATGMPSLFDASRLILRYDVLVNGGFGNFALDGELPYRVRSYLKRHAEDWGRPSSFDLVDIYSRNPIGRVFLARDLPTLYGGASDIPDLEAVEPIAAFATDTSGLRPHRGLASSFEFQEEWDDVIDEATSHVGHLDVRTVKRVTIEKTGDYEILVHRRPQEVPSNLIVLADGVQVANPFSLETRLRRYAEKGALWIPLAAVHLRRGSHDIAVSVASSLRNQVDLIGDNAASLQDYFNRMAVIPMQEVLNLPKFSYRTASLVGIRIPAPGESRKVSLEVGKKGQYRVSALLHIPRADREFPVVTVQGSSLSFASGVPFISQDGVAEQNNIPLPLYWYVASPLPRIAPEVDVQYFGQPIDFTVRSPQPFRGVFSISLSGLNAVRAATLTTGGAQRTTLLRGSLGPFKTVEAATALSGRPASPSVPITIAGVPQHVDVTLTPALAVWGVGRGLPLGMNLGAWIRLNRGNVQLYSGDIPGGKVVASPDSPVIVSHPTPSLPPNDLASLRVFVSPSNAVLDLAAQANVYLRCNNESRIYQVPVVGTPGASFGSLSADLAVLRTVSTARGCKMFGFALKMQSLPGYASVPLRILKAQVFARNAWLKATRPIAVDRKIQDGALELTAILSPRQRIISIALPTGPLPEMAVSINGHPLGEPVELGRWRLSSERLPLHNLLVASPSPQTEALAADNPGRTSLTVGGRTIPRRQQASLDGPFWYLKNNRVYLAWPQRRRFPNRGSIVVIPATWFRDHGSRQQIELDAFGLLRKGENALAISVTSRRYLDVPYSIAAFQAALEPQTTFPFTIDGRPYSLGIRDSGATGIARSNSVSVTLKRGYHTVQFDPYSNGVRLYFSREPLHAATPPLTAVTVASPMSSLWRVGIPPRKSTEDLILLESFDKNWELHGVAGAKHFVADGYSNGWILPPGAAASVTIYYGGENWVLLGVAISCVTALLLLIWGLGTTNRLRWIRRWTT